MASCPLCRRRKGKRACPAKGELICSHCCGAKRRVEIACPEDCAYLGAHAGGWEGRETERNRDLRRLAPHVQGLEERQVDLLFFALQGLAALGARLPELTDRLLHGAVAALRKTAETRQRGVLYEHPAEDFRAQGLVHELAELLTPKDERGTPHPPSDADLVAVLRSLETALDEVAREGAGPAAFLETAARLTERRGPPRASAPPLIVEG
jgi:hypothetical protein